MSFCLILGDPHIGGSLLQGKVGVGSALNSRIADQLHLLDWTLDKAIEHSVSDIIITGDVFDDCKPHPTLITLFISWLKKCQAYHTNVHLILGNHDLLRSGNILNSSLDIISEIELDNVFVYKDIYTIIIGGTAITLLPFRDRKSFLTNSNSDALEILKNSIEYELASIPITYQKIVVGHLAIEGSLPVGNEIDDMMNELMCPIDLFTGYDYVWMGHIHKPQVMHKSNPYVAHIGSMDISNFGETDHKKNIVIVDCDVKNQFITKYLPNRQLKKCVVFIPKDIVDTTAYVINEIKDIDFDKSIVRVEVTLSDPELKSIDKSVIEKFLTEQGAFNIAGISESKKVALIRKDVNNTIDTKMDISSAIKLYASAYIDENTKDGFIELATEVHNTYKAEAKE